jgi:hypothetical protein
LLKARQTITAVDACIANTITMAERIQPQSLRSRALRAEDHRKPEITAATATKSPNATVATTKIVIDAPLHAFNVARSKHALGGDMQSAGTSVSSYVDIKSRIRRVAVLFKTAQISGAA